jgi:ABC-type transporter Mla subunit MlaD
MHEPHTHAAPAPHATPPNRPVGIDLDPEARADEVFLTPRVVDQGAFDRFGTDLRRLITDAATAGRALLRTGAETDSHLAAMRDASGELRKNIETGARLIPTLDQRIERIDEALASATEADIEARVAEQLDTVVRDRVTQAAQLAAEIGKRLGATIESGRCEAEAMTERLEAAARAANEAAARAEQAEARATEMVGRAETAVGELVEMERRIGDALVEAESTSTTLRAAIDEVATQVRAAGDVSRRVKEAAGDPVLIEAVRAGESAKRTLLRAIREGKSLTQQAELARKRLAEDILLAADRIDEMERALDDDDDLSGQRKAAG